MSGQNSRLVSERLFRALLEALLSGRYGAGEKLPTQRALANDLGVAMGPLREALKRLEQMGLVEVRHGDAMRVRDWRRHGGLDVIGHLLFHAGAVEGAAPGFDAGILADVMEARRLMLGELAALAAANGEPAHAQRLTELAGGLARADDAAAAQRLDFVFFTEMAEAAGNLVFVLILNSIRELYLDHAEALPVTARHDELAPAYARAAAAIAARDAEGARAVVLDLAERQRERVEGLVRR